MKPRAALRGVRRVVVKDEETEAFSREALRGAHRVLVKAGTSVVANDDGRPSLTRMGAMVEQIAELTRSGIQVIFVSSGAVGMGKRLLKKQGRLNMSLLDHIAITDDTVEGRARSDSEAMPRTNSFQTFVESEDRPNTHKEKKQFYDSACAAAGQFEMMNLYSSLFNQVEVSNSQLLLTQADFQSDVARRNLIYAVDRMLALGIVPILNENDAVSGNSGYTAEDVFSDNDSLAALCARTFGAEVLVLLTDVDGVYDKPPSEEGAKVMSFYNPSDPNHSVPVIGEKSALGRGGMQSKIDAALSAVQPGSQCQACVVASGSDLNAIRAILSPVYDPIFGPPKGTLFYREGTELEKLIQIESEKEAKNSVQDVSEEAREAAMAARTEARKLQALSYIERKAILSSVADALVERQEEILKANLLDLIAAEETGVSGPLVKRLLLTEEKISTLATGIRQLSEQAEPLGVVKAKRELADGLELSLITVPIGVLMIIFESRPDSMPQISALALASGNGLLLKGGKEAAHSNAALHNVIGDAIESGSNGKISRDIIALVTSRGQVADMLNLDDVIDLVIPRGGNELVSYIKANTRIPVLGHADGVCHVYVDSSATDTEAACKMVVDAKTDYPSACNAMETLLLHKDTLQSGMAMNCLMSLRLAGVKCLGGPQAMNSGLCDVAATELKREYGDLTCMVEVVDTMDDAIDWIHKYGSGHTESIICSEDAPCGEDFLRRVDAACVFKNASTRFADGFRFGLGAEVGISTGRIHARGPVGVEGLLTTKWQLRSEGINYVAEFAGDAPAKSYTHKELL